MLNSTTESYDSHKTTGPLSLDQVEYSLTLCLNIRSSLPVSGQINYFIHSESEDQTADSDIDIPSTARNTNLFDFDLDVITPPRGIHERTLLLKPPPRGTQLGQLEPDTPISTRTPCAEQRNERPPRH